MVDNTAPVNRRRAYFECRYGQLHVRTAFPPTGGFDERTPMLCLHEHPRSSLSFAGFLTAIGTDRSVYACDTPGCGESDPPPPTPSIADYALAIGDLLDALRLPETDLFGLGMGAALAVELAISRPRGIRRLVLFGLPLSATPDAVPGPVTPTAGGEHLLREWQRSLAARGSGESLEALAAGFADELRNGPHATPGHRATAAWSGTQRVPLVTQPTLVLRARDRDGESAARAARLMRAATLDDVPGAGFLAAAPDAVASRLRRFLDR